MVCCCDAAATASVAADGPARVRRDDWFEDHVAGYGPAVGRTPAEHVRYREGPTIPVA